jgi:phospholipase/lecithinase/hemolysin
MREYKLAVAVLAAAVLAGCGGGSSGGNQSTKIQYTSQVSFGDSLSDVGTYDVGAVAALHGGKFTVNTLTPTAQNWTELMAASLSLAAPCAAQTGLAGLAADGFSVAVTNHAGCYGYAQGGSRVTLPYGPGNVNLASVLGGSAVLGSLTVPVVTQIQNHLSAVGGKFSGTEAVFVLAGANDVFVQYATSAVAAGTAAVGTLVTNQVTADVTAQASADIKAGACVPTTTQATNCSAQAEGELWQASLGSAAAVSAAVTTQVTADVTAGTCTPANAQASNCVTQAETELVSAYFSATGGAVTKAEGELWQASLGSATAVSAAVTTQVTADVTAGTCTPANAQATNCVAQAETELVTAYFTAQASAAGNAAGLSSPGANAAIAAVAQAGKELAGYVNTMIVGNGAKYVTVVNVPDIGTTPLGNSFSPAGLALMNSLVATFNTTLQNNLASSSSILYVDANTQNHLNTQNPSQYGITNATTPACNLASTANPLGSSLVCNTSNVISGDVSHYLFADTIHPTPYGYSLLAKYVATQMANRGWL